ncbi:MAG: hypothetical protein ABI338_07835 [Gemmatimonadaceae bacterium]
MKVWRGRNATPLLIIWVLAVALAATVHQVDEIQPAFADLFRPAYYIIAGVALLVTWKWFNERAGGKVHDRRHGDRRHTDRRDDNSES